MTSIFENIHFVMLVAFLITFILLVYYLKKRVSDYLQSKIDGIATSLQEAENLLTEASSLLYKQKLQLTQIERTEQDKILKAKSRADSDYEKAFLDSKQNLESSKKAFDTYLNKKHSIVLYDMRSAIIDAGFRNILSSINDHIDSDKHRALIEKSIDNLAKDSTFLKKPS